MAGSAVVFGVMFPLAGGSLSSTLGSTSTVGDCSTVGGDSSVAGQSTVGGESSVCGAPTTPFISNLPASGSYGGSFVAVVATNGDGMKFVTSGSPTVCTVGPSGLLVRYTGVGACSLTAHVSAGSIYPQADGSPQTFTVFPGVPTTPRISNVPRVPVVGGSFHAVISTDGDGTKSVTTTTPFVCVVERDRLTVMFTSSGTCSLTARVAAGAHFLGAVGTPQSFTVTRRFDFLP